SGAVAQPTTSEMSRIQAACQGIRRVPSGGIGECRTSKLNSRRNCIQHFATPDRDLRTETTDFIYKVVDPILGHFWNKYAIEYVDLDGYEDDIFEMIYERGLKVRYPDHMKEYALSRYG
ncbi:hypothetical protein, partial [Aeromonas hydrophila]|uniref:hypothetical protein n=1 Tax=Aeromonas hydrophila TaxID=644 RepID=UPI0038D107B7